MKYLFQTILFTCAVLGVASFGVAQELVEHSTFSSIAKIITYDKDKWELQIDTQNCSESFSDKDIIAALLGARQQYELVKHMQIKGKFAKNILEFIQSPLGKKWLHPLESLKFNEVTLNNECVEYLVQILKSLEKLKSFQLSGSYVTQPQSVDTSLDEFKSVLCNLHKKFFSSLSCELEQSGNVVPLVQKKLEAFKSYNQGLGNFSSSACLQDLQKNLEL